MNKTFVTNLDFWMPLWNPLHVLVLREYDPCPDPVYWIYHVLGNVMNICKNHQNAIYHAEHENNIAIYEKYVEEYVEALTYFFKFYNETYVDATKWLKSYSRWTNFKHCRWTRIKHYWKEFIDCMEKEIVPKLKEHSLNRECMEAIEVNRLQLYNDWKWMKVRDVIMASQKEGNLFNKLPSELVRNICEYVQ